ncbi:thioredoxin [candidate division KSB1 bacterium]|nr:thioredoxin [candidate division KSB1 bacterium]
MSSNNFDFQKDVLEASKDQPVVVDFWAEWCAPCRILGPVLEKLSEEADSKWKLVKVNTEAHPQVAMQYRIQSIPAVKMFYNGQVTAEFVGALPENQVRRWLEENIPTKSKRILEEAKEALSNGDKQRAQKLFEQAWQEDDTNYEARIHLAELVFEIDPEKANRLVADTPEEHPLHRQAEAIQTLYRLIHDYETIAQDARKSDTSSEAWESYLSGIQALRQQSYEVAVKKWIDALMINRDIDDDGPRKACVAMFNWLGQEHELTEKFHRTFTSALF